MAYALTDNLKSSILNDAILGKLTEHNYNDHSVFNLIANAKKACSKATIDGHKVKKKEINLDYCFEEEIPENWSYVKLGEICIIGRGGSPRPINAYLTDDPNGINWIKIGDTEKGGKYIYQTKERIIKEGMKKSRYVHEGDFLLTNSMSFGRPYILKTDGCIHDGWLVISQPEEVFIQDYLYYLLSSEYAYNHFTDKVSGAVVKNLNSDKVADSIFPVPPIEEQARIVAKVDELMAKIDEYEKLEKELTELKEKFPGEMRDAILQAAMSGKLSRQLEPDSSSLELVKKIDEIRINGIKNKTIRKTKDISKISEMQYDIPETWKQKCFGEITSNFDGNRRPISKNDRNNGIYPYYGATGQIDNVKDYIFDGEYLMIGEDGGNFFVNRDNSFIAKGKFWANNHVHVVQPIGINIKFLKYFLDSCNLPAMGLINGIAVPKLNQENLNSIQVPIPPIEEQQRIVDKLDKLLPMCDELVNLC